MKAYLLPFFIIFFVSVFSGCGGGSGDPPNWNLSHSTKKEIPAAQPIPATEHLVIYLDTSASMAGYVSPNGKTAFAASPDGNTIFSKALLAIREAAPTMSPEPQVVFRRVDSSVSVPSLDNLELSRAAKNRSLFIGKETNLAGAIKVFSDPLDKDSENPVPPRFHILITDGVQSSSNDNSSIACAKGSDSFCVKKQLHELMNKDWGGAVLGLKSEFNGNLYSETNHTAIPVNTGRDPNKFRPFYLYIFSPDRTALDKLVESLRQKLLPLGREDSLREYALTTDYSSGPATVEPPLIDKQAKELIEARLEKSKDGEIPRVQVKAALDTESKGKQQFTISVKPAWSSHALAGGNADELAQMIKWDLKRIFPEKEDSGARYPEFNLVGKPEVKNGNVDLTFETGWLKAPGDAQWGMYQLIGKLDVDKTAPPWVSTWTTQLDTNADSAAKTLNLESSVASLWKNKVLEDYPVAEISIRVGRK